MSLEINRSDIVVVVPTYRNYITDTEQFSLRHIHKYLTNYDIRIVSPKGLILPQNFIRFEVEYFDAEYFESIEGYNALMLSQDFYKRFSNYKYMLIYQLDALVFSDRLLDFCRLGWDYMGAPWFISEQDPTSGFLRSGNGGLSLRKIDSFLNVLSSVRFRDTNSILNFIQAMNTPFDEWGANSFLGFFKRANVARKVRYGITSYLNNYMWNEDRFWAFQSMIFDPSFTIAPIEVGLKFAFEKFPEYCFSENDYTLPFGCHAWHKHNRHFWEPYLEYE